VHCTLSLQVKSEVGAAVDGAGARAMCLVGGAWASLATCRGAGWQAAAIAATEATAQKISRIRLPFRIERIRISDYAVG
jgi:hypothetical protein